MKYMGPSDSDFQSEPHSPGMDKFEEQEVDGNQALPEIPQAIKK